MGRLTKQMRMLRVAHRGASETRPENTIPAYVKACVDGADVVEVDVRKTCDGAWVAIHDPNVDRTTDATGEVAGMSLAALRRLDAGASFSPEYRGTRVPTLSEVYEAVAGRAALLLWRKPSSVCTTSRFGICSLNGFTGLSSGREEKKASRHIVANAATKRPVQPIGPMINP